MTRDDYRAAIGRFEPDGALKERIAANLERRPRRSMHTLKRALVGTLAAVLVLASLTGIAMAASPEIRQAVLRFLHLTESEQVPGSAAVVGEYPLTGSDIGGRVTAWYIDMESIKTYFYPNRAVFAPDGSVESIIKWDVSGGVLREYRLEPRRTSFSLAPFGIDCTGEIAWYPEDGEALVYANGCDDQSRIVYDAFAIAGHDDTAMLSVRLPQGRPGATPLPIEGASAANDSEYIYNYYLCNLETGEVSDFLSGTEAGRLQGQSWYAWNSDLSRTLIVCTDYNNGDTTWYFDRRTGTVTRLSELTGTDAAQAFFLDDNTLFAYSYTAAASPSLPDSIDGWRYNLESGELTQVLDSVPQYVSHLGGSGVELLSGRQCVLVDGSSVSVLDLLTGETTPVTGSQLPTGGQFLSNNADTRIMYIHHDEDSSTLDTLGMLDLESGEFIVFNRDSAPGITESLVSWFGDEMIAVYGETPDGDVYMYLYEFK